MRSWLYSTDDGRLFEIIAACTIVGVTLAYCLPKVKTYFDLALLTEPVNFFQDIRLEWSIEYAFTGRSNNSLSLDFESFDRTVTDFRINTFNQIELDLSNNFRVYKQLTYTWTPETLWPNFSVTQWSCDIPQLTENAKRPITQFLCP